MIIAVTKRAGQLFSNGAVAVLGAVCLLQYVIYVIRHIRQWRADQAMHNYLSDLHTQIDSTRQRKAIAHRENTILRHFVAESDLDKSLDLVLKGLVPDSNEGFAFFVKFEDEAATLWRARGIVDLEYFEPQLDKPLQQQVLQDNYVSLTGHQLCNSTLLDSLSAQERETVEQLYVFGIINGEQLVGALVSTNLFPDDAAEKQQTSLTIRLMQSLANNVVNTSTLVNRQTELRLTKEMLELRTVSDQNFRDPREMTEAFLDRLVEIIGADRATLFLYVPASPIACKPMVRCGATFISSVEVRWLEFEQLLAEQHLPGRRSNNRFVDDIEQPPRTLSLEADELQDLGIDCLIGSAMVAPLMRNDRSLGAICIVRQESDNFDDSHLALVNWAAEYLTETILRVQRHVMAERRAGQDSLTELANRRTFDERIRFELKAAQEKDAECSLLFFDLDRFKHVNDTFGHQAGDEVLRITAGILRREVAQIRSTDSVVVARYGGEEMAVLLPGFGVPGATRIGEAIRAAVESTIIEYNDHTFNVTISVGIASSPCHAHSANGLVEAADAALYESKRSGRNCVRTADEVAVHGS